ARPRATIASMPAPRCWDCCGVSSPRDHPTPPCYALLQAMPRWGNPFCLRGEFMRAARLPTACRRRCCATSRACAMWRFRGSPIRAIPRLRRDPFDDPVLERLYALGLDAFAVAELLVNPVPPSRIELEGATGHLSLLPTRIFAREGRIMMIRDGQSLRDTGPQ